MLTRTSTGTIVDEEGVEVLGVEGAGCGRVGVLVGMCDGPGVLVRCWKDSALFVSCTVFSLVKLSTAF